MKLFTLIGIFVLFIAGTAGSAFAQNDHYPQFMQMAFKAYSNKNYELATEYYQAALDDNGDWWPAYVGLGNCYFSQGKLKDALKVYEKAMKMNPDNPTLAKFIPALKYKMGIVPTPTPFPLFIAPTAAPPPILNSPPPTVIPAK